MIQANPRVCPYEASELEVDLVADDVYVSGARTQRLSLCGAAEALFQETLFTYRYGDGCRPTKTRARSVADAAHRGVFVYYDDEPVGFVKGRGEHSLLGLRTVKNAAGEIPIRRGGKYPVSAVLAWHASTGDRWQGSDVDCLRVGVGEMMASENLRRGYPGTRSIDSLLEGYEHAAHTFRR